MFNCKKKGQVTIDQCFNCFQKQKKNRPASRVICKRENEVKEKPSSSSSATSVVAPSTIFDL